MSKGESIQYYFTRASQFREQISAIGDTLDEDELVMTALNGLTRPWDSFIQTLCARKESMNFSIVWEDCIQEESRVSNRKSLLREDDQALATYTKGRKQSNFKKSNHKPSKKKLQKKKNVTCPNLKNNFMLLRNIMLYFMLKFVINDQVGSRII